MARKSVRFELTAEQEGTLKMWVGSHRTQQRYSRRAQVILLSARGLTLEEISARSGLNRTNCLKWRKRFAAEGLEGLEDKPRKGRPPSITPWQRAQVVRLACEKPFTGANAWSRRELARMTGLGSTTVHRILEGASLKPHKVHHWCGKSPDPEFEPKQTAIIGLYLNPPENALVFSVDEKSQIQALDRTQPELPLRPRNPKRQRQPTPATEPRFWLRSPCMRARWRRDAWTATTAMSFWISSRGCIEPIPTNASTSLSIICPSISTRM